MYNQQTYINLHNDINKIYNFIQSFFNRFFTKEDSTEFNWEAFSRFDGLEKDVIMDFYQSCDSKDVLSHKLSPYEYFILLAIIVSEYHPDTYRNARYIQRKDEHSFSTLGGKITGDNKRFFPTGETIVFLLAGHNVSKRIMAELFFRDDATLLAKNFIDIVSTEKGVPKICGQLFPTQELLAILKGEIYRPEYTTDFPAQRIETKMDWEDLVLPYETLEDLDELKIWMKHGTDLMEHEELGKRIKPGYRTLFHGPPGTGKTLTASLLGKSFKVDVFRIDLSMVVSKWVGETEKNLRNIFNQAINKNWILFFDEADSLFGKRTSTNSSNDRYANQEVSYLLQRIEDFPGLVILASNLKSNIDEAFFRRFQSSIFFPMPDAETRKILWQKAFPKDFPLEPDIRINDVATKYELAGGAITNVVRYCALKAMERKNHTILLEDLEHAIIREFKKEGKIVS